MHFQPIENLWGGNFSEDTLDERSRLGMPISVGARDRRHAREPVREVLFDAVTVGGKHGI